MVDFFFILYFCDISVASMKAFVANFSYPLFLLHFCGWNVFLDCYISVAGM